MLNEFINFETISRKEWQRLHKEGNAPLTAEELDSIRSLNDKIDVQEVSDIYLPLINLIRIYQKTANDLTFSKSIFLQKSQTNRPFIVSSLMSIVRPVPPCPTSLGYLYSFDLINHIISFFI